VQDLDLPAMSTPSTPDARIDLLKQM